MGSLTRTRWITGGLLPMRLLWMKRGGESTLWRSTDQAMCTRLRRTTYEMLWPGWSTQTTGDGPRRLLNRMKKYVVSTTLSAAPWKESTIIRENVVEELTTLKQQPGKDIIIDGSATLVHSLMGTDLIDEYRFLVLLFIMGRGRRFFPEGDASDKAAACEQQEAQFRDPCSDLPAGQKITVWFCATCSPGCLSILRFHSKMYTSNEPGEAFQPNMHLVAHPVGIFTHFNGISGTEQAGGFTKCGHEPPIASNDTFLDRALEKSPKHTDMSDEILTMMDRAKQAYQLLADVNRDIANLHQEFPKPIS